jgi:hypothetical protein
LTAQWPRSVFDFSARIASAPYGYRRVRKDFRGLHDRLASEQQRLKAYTAAVQRVSTGDYTKRISTPGAFNPGMLDSQLATGQGGVPIKVGEDTIGGIAVGGAPGGDKDEACVIVTL